MFVSIRKSISSVLLSALVVGLLPPLPAFAQELSQSNASDIPQIASDALTSESSSASVALSSQSSVDNISDASASASTSSQQDKLTESTTAAGISSSSPSVKAVAAPSHGSPIDYAMLMHRMIRLRKGDPVILPDTTKDTKDIWQQHMQLLKDEERTKLASLNLDPSLIDSHISTIETMITKVDQPFESASPEFNIPDNPSSFERVADDTTVRFLKPEDIQLINLKDEWQPEASLLQKIISFFFPQAKADGTPQLPVLADTQTDGKEVVLSSAMIDLAQTLDKNPLKITNYVRSTIAFEPYAGSKKGAEGCLREKTCNDADTAALTISLLRASGIPARYRKTAGLMTRAQAQSLLGVDNPKSVYYLLAANGRPTYVVGSALPNPETTTLEQADFSSVTHFYTEWIGVEAFIDYDERGGSYTATTDFSAAKTDNDVASLLLPYEKKTWIYIDPTFQQTTRVEKALPANTDMVQFVESHMRSTDTRTPVQHFNAVAGVDLFNPDSQTKVTPIDIPYDILPPTPPFALGLTNDIAVEKWSSLPELFRQKVTLSVRKASDSTQLLTQTLYGYQMHDQEFDLSYKGATLADQQIIDSYGGIYATPPGLVKIIPIFSDDQIRTDGAVPVKIGESLIVRFVVTTRNEKQLAQDRTNEKFSVAGNNEGIYMTFSQAYEDLSRPSKELVLLGGNASMARHYVAKLQQTQQQLAGVYDQTAISQFSRAIVTENRVVSLVNGAPTTFDFKGLTIDAHVYLSPGSRRTNHYANTYNYTALLAAELSDYEAGMFTELGGLNAVSTVRGIQYAAAHPTDYTVYSINKNNIGQIDSLQLSTNTKNNMKKDVMSGALVITPNKPITNGEFSGIVYASLGPTILRFAIGEQSQSNGGFTSNTFSIVGVGSNARKVILPDGRIVLHLEQLVYGPPVDQNIFSSYLPPKSANCLKTSSIDTSITSIPNYSAPLYGLGCFQGTFPLGAPKYKVTLTENGINFIDLSKQNDTGYWRTIGGVTAFMQQKFFLNRNGLKNPYLNGQYDFNTAAGTISWHGHHEPNYNGEYSGLACPGCLTLYYAPALFGNSEDSFVVYSALLAKLEDKSYRMLLCKTASDCKIPQMIISELGFPIGERGKGGTYNRFGPFDTSGIYQQFLNGELLMITSPIVQSPKYISGRIDDCYRKRNGACTTSQLPAGVAGFGYPTEDPHFKNYPSQIVKQTFEDTGIAWDITTNSVQVEYAAKFLCDEIDGSNPIIIFNALIQGLADFVTDTGGGIIALLGASIQGQLDLQVYLLTHNIFQIGEDLKKLVENTSPFTQRVLAGMSQDFTLAYTSATCPARKIYLAARYTPDVIGAIKAVQGVAASAGKFAVRFGKVGENLAPLTKIADDAAAELAAKGAKIVTFKQEQGAVFDEITSVAQKNGSALTSENLTSLQKQAAYGTTYDTALGPSLKSLVIDGKIELKRLTHIKFGELESSGYLSGGHIYEDFERKIVNDIIKVSKLDGTPISSLSEVTPINGVRKVRILFKGGYKEQTIFPKGVKDIDWRNAAIDVLDTGNKVDSFTLTKNITISSQEGIFTFKAKVVKFGNGFINTFYPEL